MLPDDEIDELMWSTPVNEWDRGRMTIVAIDSENVWLDVGSKYEAPIPLSEWNEEPLPKVGDKIHVIDRTEPDAVDCPLSIVLRKHVKINWDWQELIRPFPVGGFFTGLLVRQIREGFLVRLGTGPTLNVFLPNESASRQMIEAPDSFIGQNINCRIVEIDDSRRNLVIALVAPDEATE